MSKLICPNCHHLFDNVSVGGKLICALSGMVIGRNHPGAALLCLLVGLAIGDAIDDYIEKNVATKCPECGVLIKAVARLI